MNDTPRTDAVYFKQGATMYDLANEMKLVEHELNTANVEIEEKRKDIVYLATEKVKLEERIKRMEIIISRAKNRFIRDGSNGMVAIGMLAILEEERRKP